MFKENSTEICFYERQDLKCEIYVDILGFKAECY